MSNISSILYHITIYPFELLINTFATLLERTALGPRLIIIGILVNIVSIPLYNIADKWQKKESDLQKKFKPKIDEIKAVFSGDKRQMIIQTYYRINNYHPIYSLRGLFGLMIQVPIFIAAYKVITSISDTTSFLMLSDLSKPDALLKYGSLSINILPFVMTIINVIASMVHTRNLSKKERMPLFVMAILFLVLLYNSPSSLLIYWTTANLFSLVKNLILINPAPIKKVFQKTKTIWVVLSIIWLLSPLPFYFQLIKIGSDTFKVITPVFIIILLVYIYLITTSDKYIKNYKSDTTTFLLSIVFLTLLFGIFIPSSLISSSPQEFQNTSNIILNILSKSAGIILVYPMIFYFAGDEKIKKMFTLLLPFLLIVATSNTFIFTGNYGSLTKDMLFDNKDLLLPNTMQKTLNLFVILLAIFIVIAKLSKTNIYKTIAAISSVIIISISFYNIHSINKEHIKLAGIKENINNKVSKIIDMSENGENVFILFFDAATSSYIPIILEDIPELKKELDGFCYYPQALSFGVHTVSSISSVFGGYEYTPLEMNKRNNETLKDKHNESILVLPKIFNEHGYKNTIIYPSYAGWSWEPDISALKKYDNLKVYSRPFSLQKKQDTNNLPIENILISFSLFRISPMVLRANIYNYGNWSLNEQKTIPLEVIEYQYIKELTNMVNIVSNTNTYTYFGNDMVHDSSHFNNNYLPELEKKEVTKEDIEKYGSERIARRLYANTKMLLEIVNFSKYLKKNNIYNNTKIIVVSDHGDTWRKDYIFNISSNDFSDTQRPQGFQSFLLVKDFNSVGDMKIDTNFMTTADTPIIATSHFTNIIINPFTKKELNSGKKNGIMAILTPFSIYKQNINTFNIDSVIHIKPDIFDTNNWKEISNK